MNASEAAKNALQSVLEAKEGESIVIFCDEAKAEIGEAFKKGAKALKLRTKLVVLKTSAEVFRTEIPKPLMKYLTTQRPDMYVNILTGTREETPFRIKLIHLETQDHKTRLGHCPGISLDMLTQGALAFTAKEHEQMQNFAEALMEKLNDAVKIEIKNPAGTNISLSVKNRPFFTDTRIDWKLMKWMNLPTGEVIVTPVENSLEGKLVCDLAIGGIGPVNAPVTIKAKQGKVDSVTSKNAEVLRSVQDALHVDAMAKVVGEFAFGINPKARFTQEFLEAEKMRGTVHIAFGANTDMPSGENNSTNHMDFLISKPTVNAITKKGAVIRVLVDGVFQEADPEEEAVEEKLPISEFYKVVDYTTIFKSDKWWEAIVIFEAYGKRQIGLYLWQKRKDVWKRKNKFGVRSIEEWNKLKNAVDQLATKLATK
jgi:leucyl aminopeptidase (aminopeptidase T)